MVAGLVRDSSSEKAKALAAGGAGLVVGDLKDPASLRRALAGVRTVICTASATLSRREGDSIDSVDRAGVQSLITLAEEGGVTDFIFVSFDHTGQTYPLALAKRAAEEQLKASKLNWTILQPSCFSEVWLSPALGFDVAAAKARIYGSGDEPLHYIALDDVAQAVVGAVGNAAASRQTFRFGGPPASQRDAVRVFEQLTGRPFTLETMSLAEIRAAASATDDPLTRSMLGIMEFVATGFKPEAGCEERLGVKTQTLAHWAQRMMAPAPA